MQANILLIYCVCLFSIYPTYLQTYPSFFLVKELRSKNWKTVEALNSVEQNYQKLLKSNQKQNENEKPAGSVSPPCFLTNRVRL